MLERIWSGKSRCYWILLPFSFLFGFIVWLRRLAYRTGFFSVWHSPVPIVIIGNITVGGTGKTPLVIWLVEQLCQQGIRVGVVMRGYGAKANNYPLKVTAETSVTEVGDEAFLIYQRTHVPVAIAPKRRDAVQLLLQQHSLDIIISDDGLQHYALGRAMEIVVIDGVRRFGNGWWLPAGPMRERSTRLLSVDARVVNGGQPQAGEIGMQLMGTDAINLLDGSRCSVEKLTNVVAMAGIGYPQRFFTLLQELGLSLLNQVSFDDHQHYDVATLSHLVGSQQTLLMTEKDAVKCMEFAQKNWWYLPVTAHLSEEPGLQLVQRVKNLIT